MKYSKRQFDEQVSTYQDAGLMCMPLKTDGTKAAVGKWKSLQNPEHPDLPLSKFRGHGIGIVCGEASGGLELLDFDCGGEAYAAWAERVESRCPGLLVTLPHFKTPSGGDHVVFRCDVVGRNDKLAMRKDGEDKSEVLIETRAEGGYFMAAGSPPDPKGRTYTHESGPALADVPTITPEQRSELILIAREFNEIPVVERLRSKAISALRGYRPGDKFNEVAPWEDILEPHGWVKLYTSGGLTYWRRPGKYDGHSATTGCVSNLGNELFCVFSSATEHFEGPNGKEPFSTHTKFDVLTRLWFEDDYSEAVKAIPDFLEELKPPQEMFPTYNILELEALVDQELSYPIPGVLCKNHHGMVLGPSKGMKTTISADLGISVATGTPFLGTVPVEYQMRVGFMSGESGLPTLRKNVLKIYEAKGRPEGGENFHLCPKLPKVTEPRQLLHLEAWLDRLEIELLILDPMYLCVDAKDDASSLFAMGEKLGKVGALCDDRGVTLLINHHFTQGVRGEGSFQNASWAGSEQWMRQWLVVSRMQPYVVGSSEHHMRISTGGSPGHSAGWDVTIQEENWDLTVVEVGEADRDKAADTEEQKSEAAEWRSIREAIQLSLNEEPDQTLHSLCKSIDKHREKVKVQLKYLESRKEIVKERKGKLLRFRNA